jgi:cyclophilin family peptidyl-prolyl cis-trans isomerase
MSSITASLPPSGSALELEGSGLRLLDTAELFDLTGIAGTVVEITTNARTTNPTLYLELYDQEGAADVLTPATADNFLAYVNDGSYDNSFIHRSIENFVLQGGGYVFPNLNPPAAQIVSKGAIANEPGNSNRRGTVAMAKQGNDPNSATSQFFFNLADNSLNLDSQNQGFTVFAEVLGDGMDTIDAWASLNTANFGGAFTNLPLYDTSQVPTIDNFLLIEETKELADHSELMDFDIIVSDPSLQASITPWGDILLGFAYPGEQPAQDSVELTITATNKLDGERAAQTITVNWEEPDELTGQAVYRLFNPETSTHLYSTNAFEVNLITSAYGWINEGAAYIAPGDGDQSLYRFYVPSEGRHFYTANETERDIIIANNDLFNYEGEAYDVFSSANAPAGALAVVRYFNSETNAHVWSTSLEEQSILDQSSTWTNEGIAWYSDPVTNDNQFASFESDCGCSA